MYKLIYLSLFMFVSLGCQQKSVEIIDANRLKDLQSQGVQVVDIRTLNEYSKGHIPDVVHKDYYAEDFIDSMKKLKNKPIIIYCAVGGRSGVAANALAKLGFDHIYDYSGGFSDWKKRGEAVEN